MFHSRHVFPTHTRRAYTLHEMKLEDYKTILYRQEDGPASQKFLPFLGDYVLMDTREAALAERNELFALIADEYREKGRLRPADTTEIVNA